MSDSEKDKPVINAEPNPSIDQKDYPWKHEQEQILRKWADKGQCLKAMHERAYKRYWCLNAWFNIPIIILSTLTGTGNFAQSLFGSWAPNFILIVGATSIFIAMLQTVGQYTGVAQKLESHRIAAVTWDKFTRKIQVELSKPRCDRVSAKDFINNCEEQFDRLVEVSPVMPNDIIRWFGYVIKTGVFEEDVGECNNCCYECFCFPFGCKQCNCCNSEKVEQSREQQLLWKQIELPDIMGRFKPTEIATENINDIIISIPQTPISSKTYMNNTEELKLRLPTPRPGDEYRINMQDMNI